MELSEILSNNQDRVRIIQELVPGRQITLAHVIAAPDEILYQKLGLNPNADYHNAAIGILTISPAETAVITADIAMKAANVELGFVDRFSGTLIITGKISDVENALRSILVYVKETLGFTVCEVTRT